MKRFLCFLISMMIIVSSFSIVGFSVDNNHWAYHTIIGLINDGIVLGDQNGNLNLDNNITRAEFVKTVNKYFNLTKKSEINFKDVLDNAWYYEDMLIAKEAGYIQGDQNENANPDIYITRAEVCIAIARLLELSDNTDCSFTDYNEIPVWAKGAIGSLYAKGVINGYEDGSFKADNFITRAEAFVMITRNNKNISGHKGNENSSSSNVFIPSGNSSGAFFGSSGGGGSVTVSHKAELSTRYFNKETKDIEFVSTNAKSYNIKFVVNNRNYVKELSLTKENGTYKYANFSDLVAPLINEVGINGFDADIYIQAVGTTGYTDSAYVVLGTVFLELDVPEVSDINMEYNTAADNYDLTWSPVENATGYKISLYSDKTLERLALSFETTATSYAIDTSSFEFEDLYYVTVTAKIDDFYGNSKTSCGNIVKGFGGGDGTKEKPYLMYSLEHINNIKLAKKGNVFKQMVDITGETPVETSITDLGVEFTGIYDGNNKKLYINLSSDTVTSSSTGGFGLFPLINGATFKNIILEGSVSGRGNVGGLAGRGTGKCIFENISNYAAVTSSVGYAAGIIGRMYDGVTDGTTLKNCINYGEIKWTIVNKIDTKRERLRGKHLLKSQFFFVGRQVSI